MYLTRRMFAQTHSEIVNILKSLDTVKDIRLRINAAYFGVSWASSQDQETFNGTISSWNSRSIASLGSSLIFGLFLMFLARLA